MNFGADKDVGQAVPNVVAKAAAEIFHEVVAAGVVDAAGNVTRGQQLEAIASDADASKKIQAKLLVLADLRLEERVDVGEDRAVGLAVARIVGLMVSPSGFCVKAEMVFESDVVNADVDVGAALFRWWLEVHRVIVRGRRHERAAADHEVCLLSGSECGKQKNGAGGYKSREFSQ